MCLPWNNERKSQKAFRYENNKPYSTQSTFMMIYLPSSNICLHNRVQVCNSLIENIHSDLSYKKKNVIHVYINEQTLTKQMFHSAF